MKIQLRLLSLLCVAGVLGSVGLASADVKRSDFDREGGYHEFVDDALLGGGVSPYGSWFKHRKQTARVALIRPRSSFVPEMLKSVDDL
jgi:hypothetical protein